MEKNTYWKKAVTDPFESLKGKAKDNLKVIPKKQK